MNEKKKKIVIIEFNVPVELQNSTLMGLVLQQEVVLTQQTYWLESQREQQRPVRGMGVPP
jgi:hypothetical protein